MALKQITSGKAPGADSIQAVIYKCGGEVLEGRLTTLFQYIWKKGHVPQDFEDASIIHIYKRKGSHLATTTDEYLSSA